MIGFFNFLADLAQHQVKQWNIANSKFPYHNHKSKTFKKNRRKQLKKRNKR